MATVKPIPLGNIAAGVNNRLQPEELAYTTAQGAPATFLQAAENIDLSKSGRAKRRKGQIRRATGLSHSIWCDGGRIGYAVNQGNLQSMTAEGDGSLTAATIVAGMPNFPLSYSRGGDGAVYWTNRVSIRRIAAGAVDAGGDTPLAVEAPQLVPAVVIGSGALRAGLYLLAVTLLDGDGRESTASQVLQVELPENSSVTLSSLDPLQVYMSGCNGDIPTLQGVIGDTGSLTIAVRNENGRRCATLNKSIMPPGQIVRHFAGRMWVAAGNILYRSDPYNYGMFSADGYLPFPANIDLMEVVENVMYVAHSLTQYFGMDLATGLQDALPYGAIPGTGYQSPKDKLMYWQTPRGLVAADGQGTVKNLQEDVLAMGPASSGATLFREKDGLRQVITTRQGAEQSVAVATSWMTAEIKRKGTVL
jgi:hypothetical protein